MKPPTVSAFLKHPVALGGFDQFLVSASNFGLVICIARASTPIEFGVFSLAYLGYLLLVALERACVGEILIVRHPGLDSAQWARPARRLAAAIGAVFSIVLLASWLLVREPVLLAFAAFGPVLAVQEFMRQLAYAQHRMGILLLNDGARLGSQAVLYAFAVGFIQDPGAASYALLWGASAVLGATLAVLGSRVVVAEPPTVTEYVRTHASLIRPNVMDAIATSGATQLIWLLITTVASPVAVAAVRGCQTLFGPLNSVQSALAQTALPHVAHMHQTGGDPWPRLRAVTALMTSLTLAALVALLAMTDAVGYELLGPTWRVSESLLLPVGLTVVIISLQTGFEAWIRGMGLFGTAARLRLMWLAPIVVAWVGGTAAFGIYVAAWASVAVNVCILMSWASRVASLRLDLPKVSWAAGDTQRR